MNVSKSEKSAFFRHIFVNYFFARNFFLLVFQQNIVF